ncbi:zinc ribbon domain-containing protein [candidate division KSB1 bacterium]|nr:zinc ribbon domain-containing protein [candidate division KSB1 bacterium]
MPTYDYDCASCNQTFEIFQSITAPPLDKCPTCGGKVQRRIHGGTGLIFKGSGFYLTDYKKSNSSASDNKSDKGEDKAKPAAPSEKSGADKSTSTTAKNTTTSST